MSIYSAQIFARNGNIEENSNNSLIYFQYKFRLKKLDIRYSETHKTVEDNCLTQAMILNISLNMKQHLRDGFQSKTI